MKYCQNPYCYQYDRQNNLRKINGEKFYTNTRRTRLDYFSEFCTQRCVNDFLHRNLTRIINIIGRLEKTRIRKLDTTNAWHKNEEQLEREFQQDKTI